MENNWLDLRHLTKNDYETENKLFLNEKEMYDKIDVERSNEINTLNNKIKYDKLTYHFKNVNKTPISFNDFNRPLSFIRKIKDGSIDLEKAKKNQEKFKSNLKQ